MEFKNTDLHMYFYTWHQILESDSIDVAQVYLKYYRSLKSAGVSIETDESKMKIFENFFKLVGKKGNKES